MAVKSKLYRMTPKEIVAELDKYIIGQEEAKKSVAIALRNRYRRSLLSEEMREEITPKNILMMGPTGCGKTEIARRLSRSRRRSLPKSVMSAEMSIPWYVTSWRHPCA